MVATASNENTEYQSIYQIIAYEFDGDSDYTSAFIPINNSVQISENKDFEYLYGDSKRSIKVRFGWESPYPSLNFTGWEDYDLVSFDIYIETLNEGDPFSFQNMINGSIISDLIPLNTWQRITLNKNEVGTMFGLVKDGNIYQSNQFNR